jgi:hypothetical protein
VGVEQRRLEVVVDEIGPSLAWATAIVTKTPSTLNSIPFTAAGNLTADPELRFTGTGKPVTGLRIAVPRAASTATPTDMWTARRRSWTDRCGMSRPSTWPSPCTRVIGCW